MACLDSLESAFQKTPRSSVVFWSLGVHPGQRLPEVTLGTGRMALCRSSLAPNTESQQRLLQSSKMAQHNWYRSCAGQAIVALFTLILRCSVLCSQCAGFDWREEADASVPRMAGSRPQASEAAPPGHENSHTLQSLEDSRRGAHSASKQKSARRGARAEKADQAV